MKQTILTQSDAMAQRGLRVLGLAMKPLAALPADPEDT
jgi:magnesium-transporting ATPase (P-type)